jgi:acetyl-CoA carboxylase biotin carboxyl carrier protein
VSDDHVGQHPAGPGGGAPEGIEALTAEILPALIARLRASRLGELEVRSGHWRVRLRRDPAASIRSSAGTTAGGASEAALETTGSVARSPAVGYFIPAPELMVGATVQAGDLLGTVDVLGITQEVTAPADGIVTSVLAEEGQAVEYGQALVEVDPLEVDVDPLPASEEMA